MKSLAFKYVLFGPARPGHPHWEAFRGRWPSVAHMLEEIKEGDHGTAARVGRRIEASPIIGGVAERFRVERPDLPIQTIHDSVLVFPEAVDYARDTILDVYGSIGLAPQLKRSIAS